MMETIRKAALDLLAYCRFNNWAGFDPYDGLTSPLFRRLPFLQNRAARLAAIQFMKRSSINLRPLLGIVPDQNPKALALFVSALVKLVNAGLVHDPGIVRAVVNQLIDRQSPGRNQACWGYNFDWQTRFGLVPKFTPNIICTSFAGNALLDVHEKFGDRSFLQLARSAGRFILTGLNISENAKGICFSYTPLDRAKVHNANLLGAAFLARLHRVTGEKDVLDHAARAVRYSALSQSPDGSWPYGENQVQKWIDNFHTGYNLTALDRFSHFAGIDEYEQNIRKGFAFYRSNFFERGCLAKYYHNRLYPIDIHSIAQSIITLLSLQRCDAGNMPLARDICSWALANMKDEAGFFYYQKKRWYTNRISYMRWSQAWMLLALAGLLEQGHPGAKK
jgi:hypothetical protein